MKSKQMVKYRARVQVISALIKEIIQGKISLFHLHKFWQRPENPRGAVLSVQEEKTSIHGSFSIVYVFHIFHKDYLQKLLEFTNKSLKQANITILVSTSKQDIYENLKDLYWSVHPKIQVRFVPNRGRNFGPLFVEFASEIRKHDILIHLHSKKSSHSKGKLGVEWGSRAWKLLALDERLSSSTIATLQSNVSVGLLYPYVEDLVRPINLAWSTNYFPLVDSEMEHVLPKPRSLFDPLQFPAGGMFAAKVDALLPLLRLSWAYSQFPVELGQVDGTLQHGLERAIGKVADARGFSQVTYDFSSGTFFEIASNYSDKHFEG